MSLSVLKYSIAVGALMAGLSSAQAFYRAVPAEAFESAVQPVAMCGFSCRGGGRDIPGPPGVCAERGLNYCGSSRDAPAFRGGGGPGVEFRFGEGGVRVAPTFPGRGAGGGCRTVTIERADGSVSRIRRCD